MFAEDAIEFVLDAIQQANNIIQDIDAQSESLNDPDNPVRGDWVAPYREFLSRYRGLADQLRSYGFDGVDIFTKPVAKE